MTGIPLSSFTAPAGGLPEPEVDATEATRLLRLHKVEPERWPQILYTLNEGARDYVLSCMAERQGATRTDVAEYKARLSATLNSLAALLETRGPSANSAARAIIQRAALDGAIPGEYPEALLSAFRDFARRIAPTVHLIGHAPRGREEQTMRHERFARQFLQAWRRLELEAKTGEKSLAVALFGLCLAAVFEPLSAKRSSGLLGRIKETMRDD